MGIFSDICPLCGCGPAPKWEDELELANKFIMKESHPFKWVDIDYPIDVDIHGMSEFLTALYRFCSDWNDKGWELQVNLKSIGLTKE